VTLPWIVVTKNTNSKDQITDNSQIPMFNDQNLPDEGLFKFSNFGHWDLFDIWNLTFGISTSE